MALVTKNDGTTKIVKNLGWLLKYASHNEIKTIKFIYSGDFFVSDHRLIVNFVDGTRYKESWIDDTLFKQWIKRPTFKGCQVNFFTPDYQFHSSFIVE